MFHHQFGKDYYLQNTQYVAPQAEKKPIVYATNPNTINNFNDLSRQGNQRVRIKKVYHVVKNKDVPSHHEYERKKHSFKGDGCPECIAMAEAQLNYIPVQQTPLPTFNRPPVLYAPPPVNPVPFSYPQNFQTNVPSPMPSQPNIPFSARVKFPEAPPAPVYRPPSAEMSLPINRNASSYTPINSNFNNSFNDDNSFYNRSQNVIIILFCVSNSKLELLTILFENFFK